MKRTLQIAVLAVMAVVLLSGCDFLSFLGTGKVGVADLPEIDSSTQTPNTKDDAYQLVMNASMDVADSGLYAVSNDSDYQNASTAVSIMQSVISQNPVFASYAEVGSRAVEIDSEETTDTATGSIVITDETSTDGDVVVTVNSAEINWDFEFDETNNNTTGKADAKADVTVEDVPSYYLTGATVSGAAKFAGSVNVKEASDDALKASSQVTMSIGMAVDNPGGQGGKFILNLSTRQSVDIDFSESTVPQEEDIPEFEMILEVYDAGNSLVAEYEFTSEEIYGDAMTTTF